MKTRGKQDIKETNPYKVDKLSRIPSWLIILVLKYWAAAAAVFFMAVGGISIGFDFSTETFDDPCGSLGIILILAGDF